jgi:glycosyltransferase involved in cell wall biosynthesis
VRNNIASKVLTNLSRYNIIQRSFPSISGVSNKIKQIDVFKKIDKVITVSKWQREVLLKNDFDDNKISVVRQSVSENSIINIKKKTIGHKIVFGYIGRVVPEKGFHLLYKSFENIPSDAYEIKIAAIRSPHHDEYFLEQKRLMKKLPSTWVENISSKEVISFLDELDVLLVPSAWLETGPYVIYEALARRVPVIAFNKGGATELIENEWNSVLVENEIEFKYKISKLITNADLLPKYISNINLNRTTAHMYKEMESIYAEIL